MFILNKKINGNLSALDILNSSGWTHCKQGRPHITRGKIDQAFTPPTVSNQNWMVESPESKAKIKVAPTQNGGDG